MFKRVLLGLVFLASLIWIGIVGFGIFKSTDDYSEAHVFSKEDGQLLIVNRPSEVNFASFPGFDASPSYEMAKNLDQSAYKTGFFSYQRPHCILVGSENWNSKSIQALFTAVSPKIDEINKSLTFGNWSGIYKNERLYLSQGEQAPNKNPLEAYVYDKKASASILLFGGKNDIETVSDVYFKVSGNVDYITQNRHIKQGKQVRDEQIFGSYISKKVNSYHFYERDYYATLDEVYAKGPLFKWLKAGFVEVDYAGEKVLVSDYINGQDPILFLNDLQQTTESATFKTQLTATFPKPGTTYSVKYLEDLVVIAPREEICAQFVADYKLGNTIALDAKTQKRLYSELPQAVSERFVTDDVRLSKAVYNGYLLETRFGRIEAQTVDQDESMAMSCNFDIVDFHAFPEPGNVVALGSKGQVSYFKNGQELWKKSLGSKALGQLQIIELHGGGETHILLNSEDEVHVWKLNGDNAPGFPIKLDDPAVNEVKFYRWKEKSYFLVANARSSIIQFDSEGRELTFFKSKLAITGQIDVWASQSRLFFGFSSSTNFEMFDVAKNNSLRMFAIPNGSRTVKLPNELMHFGFVEAQLIGLDQKGTRTKFEQYPNGKLWPIADESKNPTLIVQAKNTIHFINQKGIEFGKIRLPFNEIESVNSFTTNSGKTILAVIDGLENNVYLYNMAGTKLSERSLEGKTKVSVSKSGKSLLVTTVIDNYVIQYFEK